MVGYDINSSPSYEDMMGSPMDPHNHPATDVPQATQHYAGDVLPMPGEKSMGAGNTGDSIDYALGKKSNPKVQSIGAPALKSWADRKK